VDVREVETTSPADTDLAQDKPEGGMAGIVASVQTKGNPCEV